MIKKSHRSFICNSLIFLSRLSSLSSFFLLDALFFLGVGLAAVFDALLRVFFSVISSGLISSDGSCFMAGMLGSEGTNSRGGIV